MRVYTHDRNVKTITSQNLYVLIKLYYIVCGICLVDKDADCLFEKNILF